MANVDVPHPRDAGPLVGGNFRVRISGTPSARRARGLGVARVEWGPFPVARGSEHTSVIGAGDVLPAHHVLVRRAVTAASTDLADWWRAERGPKRPAARTVTVELIEPVTSDALLSWTFRRCRAVQLAHSPLDAVTSSVLTESLLFEYAEVEFS
jgi:hypothetical protein